MRHPVPLLLLLGLAACQPEPLRETVLADYRFDPPPKDELYGFHGRDRGWHRFGEGWDRVGESEGRWILAERAEVLLTVFGSDVVLELEVSTSPDLSARGQTLRVSWNGAAVDTVRVDRGWDHHRVRIPLPAAATAQGANRLVLAPSILRSATEEEPRTFGVYLRGLRLVAHQTPAQREDWEDRTGVDPADPAWTWEEAPPAPPPSSRPDVLVVVMDTARADHFGHRGYPRDTSPQVDALARDGVVLTEVLSQSPYTRPAVHGLLTGTDWRSHRMVNHDDRLDGAWVTLPEIFRGAGYRTLGWFDNAQVGAASGAVQGFDSWVETWKDRRRKGWMPELPATLFEERMTRESGDEPLFCFVHTLPPHNPYLPGEEHDRFGDPDYDGPITGRNVDLFDFVAGRYPAEGPDFERLVSLYDGALRRGDAIVGRILDAWAARPSDRGKVVVVVSDHGEGFGEHGHFGHNSTVFDGMLEVPVVLHPASRFAAVAGSEDHLRALRDVGPILLHAVGIAPPAGSRWPAHFLEVLEDPTVGRREIFARAATGLVGVRTPDTLAFFRAGGERGLFNLVRDPGARQNLVLEDTETYRRWVRRIRAYVESGDASRSAPAVLSPEDEERLRALGYM